MTWQEGVRPGGVTSLVNKVEAAQRERSDPRRYVTHPSINVCNEVFPTQKKMLSRCFAVKTKEKTKSKWVKVNTDKDNHIANEDNKKPPLTININVYYREKCREQR